MCIYAQRVSAAAELAACVRRACIRALYPSSLASSESIRLPKWLSQSKMTYAQSSFTVPRFNPHGLPRMTGANGPASIGL